jgi:hypothetical protein
VSAAFLAAAAAAWISSARADVTDTRTIEDSVRVAGERDLVVIVDNVFGSIRVTAHDRDTVDMTAIETVRGDLRADIDRARAEVELRTEQEEGRVAFRVRCIADADCEHRRNRWDGYVVEYDIEVRVPREASIDLSTVNGREIAVDGVRGGFEVKNVNGGVRLTGLRGAGSVTTVNGTIDATFERAPEQPAAFKTVNGDIDVAFPPNLAAELDFKTMRGDIYTDFDVEPLARKATGERSRDSGFVNLTPGSSVVRVASGGRMHSFQTLNGDIYVRKAAR